MTQQIRFGIVTAQDLPGLTIVGALQVAAPVLKN